MVQQAVIPFVIGVTGHRNISLSEAKRVRPILEDYFTSHARAHPEVPLRLFSGLAEGADRIVASAFLAVRDRLKNKNRDRVGAWELVVTLPFAEDAYRDDFPETVLEFRDLLAEASSVVTVTDQSVVKLRSDPSARDDGYEAQGYFMQRHSNLIIALWDGVHLDLRGGTSHVVRLKLNGHENPDNPFSVHDCGSVFHVPVQRGEPLSSDGLVAARHLFPATQVAGASELERLKTNLGRFNRAAYHLSRPDEIKQSLRYLSPSLDEGRLIHQRWLDKATDLDQAVINVFASADVMASRLDKKRLHLTRLLYSAGMVLALALCAGLDNVLQIWMVALYLISIAIITGLYWRLKRRDLAVEQLDYRLLAEALRVQIYWRMMDGVKNDEETGDEPPEAEFLHATVLDGLLSQQAEEMGWIREVLRLCGTDQKPTHLSREDRARHIHHWVNDQFAYFQRTERRYDRRATIMGRVVIAAGVSGIIAAACVVWIDQQHLAETLRQYTSIAAAALPALALLVESYKDRLAIEEQAKNMARMKAVFSRMVVRLGQIPIDQMPPLGLIRALGQEALAENVSWLVLRRSKPTVLPT